VSTLLEGPSTEVRQKHQTLPAVGRHLFDILYKERNITKPENEGGFILVCILFCQKSLN
jgi:hypothetical protein